MRAVDASANVPFVPAAQPPDAAPPVSESPAIRDAATVLLVSDRPDLHVLMMERTRHAAFGPGATVFPGGAVDDADRQPRASQYMVDLAEPAASAEQGLAAGGLAFRIAALRECFEEAGILLAYDAETGRPVEHDQPLADARVRLNAGGLAFADLLETRGLVLHGRDLRLFSHWLTPIGAPRRYNTWFFIAPAPDGEDGAHDDAELVASGWVRPADALAGNAAGEIDLIFPTEMSLRALAQYQRSQDLFADLDAAPRGPDGAPRVLSAGNGERIALPSDADRATGQWTIPLPEISYRAERAAAARETSL